MMRKPSPVWPPQRVFAAAGVVGRELAEQAARLDQLVDVRVGDEGVAEALRVHRRAVVALDAVLDEYLPVRLHGIDPVLRGFQSAKPRLRSVASGSRAGCTSSRRRRGDVGIDDDEAAPDVDRDGDEREVGAARSPSRATCAARSGACRRACTSSRDSGTAAACGNRPAIATGCARWRQTLTKPWSSPSASRVTTTGTRPELPITWSPVLASLASGQSSVQLCAKIRSYSSSATCGSEYQRAGSVQPLSSASATSWRPRASSGAIAISRFPTRRQVPTRLLES